jgi:hypothetical protein
MKELLGYVLIVGALSFYIAMETGILGAGQVFSFLGLVIMGILILLGLLVVVLVARAFFSKAKKRGKNADLNPARSNTKAGRYGANATKFSQQPILVTLKPRTPAFRAGGKNWIGGLPHLGGTPWPRDSEGAPMFFIAQFDLSDLAAMSEPTVLPTSGSLAFFIKSVPGTLTGRVLYLPTGSAGPTQPPSDLGPVGIMIGNETLTMGISPEEVPNTLPHWPVDFVAIKAQDPDDLKSIESEIETRFDVSGRNWFSYSQLVAQRGVEGLRFGDAARRFAISLRNVADTSGNVDAAFRGYVQQVSDWADTLPPWKQMQEEDIAQLEAFFAEVDPFRPTNNGKIQLSGIYRAEHAFRSLDDIYTYTLLGMVRGPDEIFNVLPEDIRETINMKFCGVQKLPRHQIFGAGWRIQDAAEQNEDNYMLLQITEEDPIVPLIYAGDIQFYISPSDLAAGRWEAAFALAES